MEKTEIETLQTVETPEIPEDVTEVKEVSDDFAIESDKQNGTKAEKGVDQFLGEHDITKVEEIQTRFNGKDGKDTQDAIDEFEKKAIDKFEDCTEGQKFLDQVGGESKLEELIQTGGGDLPTRVAAIAQQAGLEPTAIGRIVHRVAELQTLNQHPDEVADGTRLAEQRIDYTDTGGKSRHIEIDNVIQRGDQHYLRDYKPVNIQDLEKNEEAGTNWKSWLDDHEGFRERLEKGENPFSLVGEDGKIPKDVRDELQGFLKESTAKHKEQLDKYRAVYAESRNIELDNVKTAVRPYFVYR